MIFPHLGWFLFSFFSFFGSCRYILKVTVSRNYVSNIVEYQDFWVISFMIYLFWFCNLLAMSESACVSSSSYCNKKKTRKKKKSFQFLLAILIHLSMFLFGVSIIVTWWFRNLQCWQQKKLALIWVKSIYRFGLENFWALSSPWTLGLDNSTIWFPLSSEVEFWKLWNHLARTPVHDKHSYYPPQ